MISVITTPMMRTNNIFNDFNNALLAVIRDIRPVTTTIAALCIVFVAVNAIFSKRGRGEAKEEIVHIVLLVLVISGAMALAGWAADLGGANF